MKRFTHFGLLPALFLTLLTHPAGASALKKISFILTNDVHGHLEPSIKKKGDGFGGLAFFSTIVKTIRAQPEFQNGEAALFLLDSGDQFQGTYLSNYEEGKPVFDAFTKMGKVGNEVGYDAIIPGNHDYDFGPLGWLMDSCPATQAGCNPREVIEGLAQFAKPVFPLLSANTYLKASIKTTTGDGVELNDQCQPLKSTPQNPLDFSKAERPAFLTPYLIKEKAGVRVALIGIDHHNTTAVTTRANVTDLCFRNEVETYLEIRKELEGKADIFVLIMHNGNSDTSKEGSQIVDQINKTYPNGVQLAAEGHTHFTHNDNIDGVRVIQDGSEAKAYGRVDLFYDTETKKVVPEKTISKAGIMITNSPIQPDPAIQEVIDATKKAVPNADQILGEATETVTRDRISENALGDFLTDQMRLGAGTDIAFYNAGGIRADIPKGKIIYRNFFEVAPFANHAVVINKMTWKQLRDTLDHSIHTCGAWGALNFSGIKMQFIRNCEKGKDVATTAYLTHVETVAGKLIYDQASGKEVDTESTFSVVTLDYLANGGDSFPLLKIDTDLGLVRDLIVKSMVATQPVINNHWDGRMAGKQSPPATIK